MTPKEGKGEESIDLSQIGKKIKGFFSGKAGSPEYSPISEHQRTENDTLSFREMSDALRKNARWLIPLLCIILALSVSIYLRTMPLRLPMTDDWAQNSVHNFYQNQLRQQIDGQYPHLPQQNKEAVFQQEWQKFQQENRQLIDSQIAELSQQYKNGFRDDQGIPYLLGIDPYYYYRQTEYVLNNGYPGSALKDGTPWDYYRVAPLGREAEWNFHHWFGAWWHRFLNLFGDFPLMQTFFFVGTLFSALTVIPGFFIGKRLTRNNTGGFFVALLLAVSAFFVSRTTGESSDTDVYSVFFPILITWLFLEALEAEQSKKRLFWSVLAGLATGLFAFAWTGWWYIGLFLLITIAIKLLARVIPWIKTREMLSPSGKDLVLMGAVYLGTTAIFVSLFTSVRQVFHLFRGPKLFILLKAVAVGGYWPNIRTTVAELNVTPLENVIQQLGGIFLFVLGCLGIVLLYVLRKDKEGKRDIALPLFLTMWLVSSLWATGKGVRFILQVTPIMAISLGTCLGLIWQVASSWITRELKIPEVITKTVIFAVLALLLITPVRDGYGQAFNSVSSMNDGWYAALSNIKEKAPENIIITSWWDFGHWFKAIADRPVTFDGGTQLPWDAHWVGKSLLTNDERVTVGIVRMLNCGQNTAFDNLDKIINDTPTSIDLLNTIILLDRPAAIRVLKEKGLTTEQIATVIPYTHCENPPTDYFITSEDMVGKSSVWGHFGSWNFPRAVMYQKTKNMNRDQAVQYMASTFNLSPEEADRFHAEIQSTPADKWISPWPSYLTGISSCQQEGESPSGEQKLLCSGQLQEGNFAFRADLGTKEVQFQGTDVLPNSMVFATKEGIEEVQYEGTLAGFSIVIIPRGEGYGFLLADPLQAASTFTKLFFFDGHGQACFQKFDEVGQISGGKIKTWIMDYSCQQKNQVFFQPKEEVHASHLLITVNDNRTAEEALAIIEDLRKNVTSSNFAEFAQRYSEDPVSRTQGGDLGWFGHGKMVPEFDQAAFSLSDGEISEPIRTSFGYHLIYKEGSRK